ncbi:MAG: ABC transporter ATP-binding protein [Candidatus Stygibacter australis]|nr:ABC transporter ATP-binding protein [Candidatus Stygibacter australis]MDP8322866.1 ABC transporter ATP-binding protein [Candidatus Stygibacter australis]
MNNLITLKNFSFAFSEKDIFQEIDLEIPLEGVSLLSGENGSGKSTFCRLLLALQSGYKGKLLFNDLEIAGTDTESIAEEIIYLRQSPSLNLLAATSMLDLGIWQAGFEVNNIDEAAIEKALNYFDMLNYKDKPVWELSEGQRQRVALAALLLNKQKIWLLDEPAAGLDSTRQRQLKKLIIEQSKQKGILIISHRYDLFADVSEKIYEIKEKSINLRK